MIVQTISWDQETVDHIDFYAACLRASVSKLADTMEAQT